MTETLAHGTHLTVRSESFPINTNMIGFRCFFKVVASLYDTSRPGVKVKISKKNFLNDPPLGVWRRVSKTLFKPHHSRGRLVNSYRYRDIHVSIIDRDVLHFVPMIFFDILKDTHVVIVETLSIIVPFARKMGQATSHCLKCTYIPSLEGG